MKKIDSIRLAIATWIAPAGTAVVPSIARSPMPRPSIAPTAPAPSLVRPTRTRPPIDFGAKVLAGHHEIWANEVDLEYRKKAELLIIECRDPSMWYAGKVQQRVEYCGKWPEGWKSREPSGMINIIKPTDAVLVVKR